MRKSKFSEQQIVYAVKQVEAGVSIADKLHNVRSLLVDLRRLGDPLWERFSGKRDGTLWYYRSVADACRGSGR